MVLRGLTDLLTRRISLFASPDDRVRRSGSGAPREITRAALWRQRSVNLREIQPRQSGIFSFAIAALGPGRLYPNIVADSTPDPRRALVDLFPAAPRHQSTQAPCRGRDRRHLFQRESTRPKQAPYERCRSQESAPPMLADRNRSAKARTASIARPWNRGGAFKSADKAKTRRLRSPTPIHCGLAAASKLACAGVVTHPKLVDLGARR